MGLHERIWKDPSTAKKKSTVHFEEKDKDTKNPEEPRTTLKRSHHSSGGGGLTTRIAAVKAQKEGVVNEVVRTTSPRRPPRHSRRDSSTSSAAADDGASTSSSNSIRDKILASSLDFMQIELDVARCTWHLLTGTQRAQRLQMEHKRHRKVARLIRRKQRRLANLINLTLVQSYKRFSGSYNKKTKLVEKDNTLRYYQGYHDVACIILSTLGGSSPVRLRSPLLDRTVSTLEGVAIATGLEMPAAVLLQISQSHFRDCMRANFLQLQTALRLTLLPLLAYFDPRIHEFLAACETEPYFALSWVITWFSHDIRDTEVVKRLFDFFVVSHPLTPIYLAVAMVCHPLNREDILQTECDFSLVHQALSGLPRNSSMVGWKYRPGDGYVSDDDGEGDDEHHQNDMDDETSLGPMDSQSSVDTEFLLHEAGLQEQQQQQQQQGMQHGTEGLGAESVSIVSSSMSSMLAVRVPFQELIDAAISYMERMPPRHLLGLATRYYGRDQVQIMVRNAPAISFFQTPPAWTRASKAKSDHLLKQQRRAETTNGRLVRSLSSSDESTQQWLDFDEDDDDEGIRQQFLLEERGKVLAVIAAGFGPGDDAERRRRKQQKRMVTGAIAVMVVAIVVGIIVQNRTKQQLNGGSGSGGAHHIVGHSAELSDSVSASCHNSGSSSSATVMATSSAMEVGSGSGSFSAMAMADNRPTGRLFRQKSPLALKNMRQFSDPMRNEADLSGGGGGSDFAVGSLPQVDLLLSSLLQMIFRETLMIGDRLGDASAAIILPPLKSFAARSKGLVVKTHRGLFRKKSRNVEDDQAISRKGRLDSCNGFVVDLIKNGIFLGSSQMKGAIKEVRNSFIVPGFHALKKKTSRAMKEYQAMAFLEANEMDRAHIPEIRRETGKFMRRQLQMLEQEFRLPDFHAIARTIQQLILELVHLPLVCKLIELKRTKLARLSQFRDKQLDTLLQLSNSKMLVANMQSSVKKAMEAPAVHGVIRRASILVDRSKPRKKQLSKA